MGQGSKLIFGITKVVSQQQEESGGYDVVAYTIAAAYEELRRAAPLGDLIINLRVEVDKPEDAGVIWSEKSNAC